MTVCLPTSLNLCATFCNGWLDKSLTTPLCAPLSEPPVQLVVDGMAEIQRLGRLVGNCCRSGLRHFSCFFSRLNPTHPEMSSSKIAQPEACVRCRTAKVCTFPFSMWAHHPTPPFFLLPSFLYLFIFFFLRNPKKIKCHLSTANPEADSKVCTRCVKLNLECVFFQKKRGRKPGLKNLYVLICCLFSGWVPNRSLFPPIA